MGAAYNGHERVISLLLQREDVSVGPNAEGETALYLAGARGHAGAAALLRECSTVSTGRYGRDTCVACLGGAGQDAAAARAAAAPASQPPRRAPSQAPALSSQR